MSSAEDTNRACWVDLAKVVAILCVLLDHLYGILYGSDRVAMLTKCSVSVFILMTGVTSYWSYSRFHGNALRKVKDNCWKIFRVYLVATLVYAIVMERQFHFGSFLNYVIHFNASGPFYYVLLYMQMVLIAPVVYAFLKWADRNKYRVLLEFLGLVVTVYVSYWTMNYTNILDVYAGGGRVFGGTYLVMLYLGMLFGKYSSIIREMSIAVRGVAFAVLLVVTLLWWNFIATDYCAIDAKVPFGNGFNPPSISLAVYAILVSSTIFAFEKLVVKNAFCMGCLEKIAVFGKHTLYVFLYHKLFLDYVIPVFTENGVFAEWNNKILILVYFVIMIGGSLLIEVVFEKIHRLLVVAYNVE